jgi:ferric-dicitrate binding protein FerR (iron transport regulator)
MKKRVDNDDPVGRADTKSEVTGWIIARLLSDDRLPEDVLDDIRSYLVDGRDTELKREALQKAFLSAFRSGRSGIPSPHASREWARLAATLGLNPDLGHYRTLWNARRAGKAGRSKSGSVRRPLWVRVASRAAAVLLPAALLAGGYLWYGSLRGEGSGTAEDIVSTLSTPFAGTDSISTGDNIRYVVLHDGTEVTLNRHSTLSYNEDRESRLSGEAWFRVAKDAAHPFVIHSGRVKVTVLGTEFNFSARPEEGRSVLSLYSGVVDLDYGTGSTSLDTAGREFSLDHETGETAVSGFDPSRRPRWLADEARSGIFGLNEIFDMIEARYGVSIVNRGAVDTTGRYNFMLDETGSIESVMSALQYAVDSFGYTISGNTVTLE